MSVKKDVEKGVKKYVFFSLIVVNFGLFRTFVNINSLKRSSHRSSWKGKDCRSISDVIVILTFHIFPQKAKLWRITFRKRKIKLMI